MLPSDLDSPIVPDPIQGASTEEDATDTSVGNWFSADPADFETSVELPVESPEVLAEIAPINSFVRRECRALPNATSLLDRLSNLRQLLSHLGNIDLSKLLSVLSSFDISRLGDLISAYSALASVSSPIDTPAGIIDRTNAALTVLRLFASMTSTTADDAVVAKLDAIASNPAAMALIANIVATAIKQLESEHAATAGNPNYTPPSHDTLCHASCGRHFSALTANEAAAVKFDFASISAIAQAVVALIQMIRGQQKQAAAAAEPIVHAFGQSAAELAS